MNFLMFSASLRKDSNNARLIQLAADAVRESGASVDLVPFQTFCAPLYNYDDQVEKGFPKEITEFTARLKSADGLIISSPEYNFSTPGTLKNLIDWVSRLNPVPWLNSNILLMSASPSLVGGNRGLWATRIPLECCGAFVYPDMYSLAASHQAFTDKSQLKDETQAKRLTDNVQGFIEFAGKMK